MEIGRTLVSSLGAMALVGCGGGGGSSGGATSPVPVNAAPQFTSPATQSVRENRFGTAYKAQASDPEGAAITLSIAGGADAARFVLNAATGELRFVVPPDFEAPADADLNNRYDVVLSASDGAHSTSLALQVSVTNDPGTYRVRRLVAGIGDVVQVASYGDESGRLMVAERGGRIRLLDPATGAFATADLINLTGHQILGLVASPTFVSDRHVFVMSLSNSNPNAIGEEIQVRRFQVNSLASGQADAASSTLIIEINQTLGETSNMGGMLTFDRDANLLIGVGFGKQDGLGGAVAQNANSLNGKLLRIDVRTTPYSIPAGNPYSSGGGAREILALGLRNPYRGSVDPVLGHVFIGDQGESAREEVNRIDYGTAGLVNFGWNAREGSLPYNGGADSPGFRPPVVEYPHGAGPYEGNKIIGGEVYRGPIDSLQGLYIFGDADTNNLWSAPASALNPGSTLPSGSLTSRNMDFAPDAGAIDGLAGIGRDEIGNLYFVGGGEIFRLEPAG